MAVTVLDCLKEVENRPAEHLKNALRYILNPKKTEQGLWVGGNVGREWREVFAAMLDTKEEWQKPHGRQGYHFKISFQPGETDEETAYAIVREFCERYLGDAYDYCFAIHNDQPHMHGHIVFNSVDRIDGHKYRYLNGDWEKQIQPITDSLCRKYGLAELVYKKDNRVGKSYAEHFAEKEGRVTYQMIVQADIDEAIRQAGSYEGFLKELQEMGYQIRRGYSDKRNSDYLSLLAPGAKRARRDYKLGVGYTLQDIRRRIQKKEKETVSPLFLQGAIPAVEPKGQLQVCSLERIRQAYYYHTYDRRRIDQRRERKDLLKIDRLREECIYLADHHLTTVQEVKAAYTDAGYQLKEALNKRETETFREKAWTTEEQKANREYQEIVKHLQEADLPDDMYEALDDRREELEQTYPSILLRKTDLKEETEQIRKLRREKNLLCRILKDSEETLKVTALDPVYKVKQKEASAETRKNPQQIRKGGG